MDQTKSDSYCDSEVKASTTKGLKKVVTLLSMDNNTWSGARPSVTKPVNTRFHNYITFFTRNK